jgi:HTH-type transcriptional regulator / antitoxin HigA
MIVAPGEHLQEYMDDNNLTIVEMANKMGHTEVLLGRFLRGEFSVYTSFAHDLEAATCIPARSWLLYERQYRKDLESLRRKINV